MNTQKKKKETKSETEYTKKKRESQKKSETTDRSRFLPVSEEDMKARGWKQCDFVFVIGDAYVDHSSFAPAIIGRVLESKGYKVGIIAQPDWKDEKSVTVLGKPRLGFLVCAGNMDSMVNHYTVAKKHRNSDAYSYKGETGHRPDRASIVYSMMIKKVFKDSPVIIGGIEGSLRRLAHYDYWSDSLKRSLLVESQADLIIYGMGERTVVQIADELNEGRNISEVTDIKGTVYKTKHDPAKISEEGEKDDFIILPSYDELAADKKQYAKSFKIQYENTDPFNSLKLVEKYGAKLYVVQNTPQPPLSSEELDAVYDLPYTRTVHPMYGCEENIPAISEIKYSLTSCRGCFGSCNYCALTFHQGRIVTARSHESILREARIFVNEPGFKGNINDVGGPTADFRAPACDKQLRSGACKNKTCLAPTPCKNLKVSHKDYLELLKKLRELPGVKKVFIRSGIRFDYVMLDKDDTFLKELCKYHVSGQLRVAPEHVCNDVLRLMGKPDIEVYERFKKRFEDINKKLNKKQYVVPYLISSHPGTTLKDAVLLAEKVRDMGYLPEQVQDFYPTPSTVSTCMYYTGVDPLTGKSVYVTTNPHEKAMQRALIQYRDKKNRALVKEALIKAGREDLIGYDKRCLLRPDGLKKKQC